MASFFSSLVGSYSDTLIKKHREEREKDERAKQAELSVIQTAIQTGQLDQNGMQAAFSRADEITKELAGGKKNKSGFSLGNLIGKFGDVGGQTQTGAAKQGGAPPQQGNTGATQGSPAAAAAPVPQSGLPGVGPPVNLGTPPQRPGGMTFRNPADIEYEKQLARVKAEMAGKSQAEKDEETFVIAAAKEAHPEWNNKQIFDNVIAPRHGIQQAEPPKPDAEETRRLHDIRDILIANPNKTYAQAEKEAAENAVRKAEGEKPNKPKISNEAGYPYIQTGDVNKDLPAAEAAMKKGVAIREGERAKADERTARRAAFNQATTTFRQNVTQAHSDLAKAKATAEAKEKEIRKNNSGIMSSVLAQNPDMKKAKAEIAAAQKKVDNLKTAQNYLNSMSLSIQEGNADQDAVLKAAEELGANGYTSSPPPGAKVTRKVGQ
jgi:hypothetical protein